MTAAVAICWLRLLNLRKGNSPLCAGFSACGLRSAGTQDFKTVDLQISIIIEVSVCEIFWRIMWFFATNLFVQKFAHAFLIASTFCYMNT